MLLPASVLSDRYGRQRLMKASLALATVIAFATAVAADFTQLLVLRMLMGAVLAGLPASAMAWLGEEIAPNAQGRAMGLYIAGNALGGMSGRFLVAGLTDWSSWRIAAAALGVLGLVATLVFWRCLPPSHHFRARSVLPARVLGDIAALLADSGLRRLFAVAFLMMGAFTSSTTTSASVSTLRPSRWARPPSARYSCYTWSVRCRRRGPGVWSTASDAAPCCGS